MVFFGTVFFAVSNNYGFNAPVLARADPRLLGAVNAFPPIIAMNALFVLTLVPGSVLLGIAVQRSHAFPYGAGILMAVGTPLFRVCSALSVLVFQPLWIVAILGTLVLGLGWVAAGYTLRSGHEQPLIGPLGHRATSRRALRPPTGP